MKQPPQCMSFNLMFTRLGKAFNYCKMIGSHARWWNDLVLSGDFILFHRVGNNASGVSPWWNYFLLSPFRFMQKVQFYWYSVLINVHDILVKHWSYIHPSCSARWCGETVPAVGRGDDGIRSISGHSVIKPPPAQSAAEPALPQSTVFAPCCRWSSERRPLCMCLCACTHSTVASHRAGAQLGRALPAALPSASERACPT